MRTAEDVKRAVYERIERRFSSGNSVPVERATITKDEWEQVKAYLTTQHTGDKK